MKTKPFLNFVVIIISFLEIATLFGEEVPVRTKSAMWVHRFDSPSKAANFFFDQTRKENFEAAYFILDNSVQNLLRALISTMDSSPFAKEGEYVFQQKEISSLVGNDQVKWHSLVFLFDQLMAIGIQKDRFPFSFKKAYRTSDTTILKDDSYSIATMRTSDSELLVLLKKDSQNNWRLVGVSDAEQSFFWPQPVESLWEKVT